MKNTSKNLMKVFEYEKKRQFEHNRWQLKIR
jgi:hypothetical protein